MSDKCCQKSGGFMFGIVCGAIVASLIAIVIYKKRDTQVIKDLKSKLHRFISSYQIADKESVKHVTKKKSKISRPKKTKSLRKQFITTKTR